MNTVEELLTAYLTCRTVGHAWDEFPASRRIGQAFAWQDSYRCTRCLTERYDAVGVTGAILSRVYVYPENYRVAGDVGRNQFRVELHRRRSSSIRRRRKTG